MKTPILFIISFVCFLHMTGLSATSFLDTDNSFAEEYKELRILLEKVTNKDSALLYKSAIENEIQQLNQNFRSGEDQFNSLSPADKKLFVKKFQKNRYHCGDVTQVMEERTRILFDPELSDILRDTLIQIP